jgi:hypothetical protein
VVTAVGLLFVKGGKLLKRSPKATGTTRLLPVVSSLAIAVIGVVITVQSVLRISFQSKLYSFVAAARSQVAVVPKDNLSKPLRLS